MPVVSVVSVVSARARWRARLALCAALLLGGLPAPGAAADSDVLALPEEPVPLAVVPERPRPVLELGDPFLAPARLGEGLTLPTGAVWRPALLVWGQLRTALQADSGREPDQAQWASRLDLFGQLSLTATERIVAHIEPFQQGRDFTGYRFGLDGAPAGFTSDLDFGLESLYFEGDLGQIFPRLDRDRFWPLDLGFMGGRVPVLYQDGFLIDDEMTGFGLVQNSLRVPGASNLRVSFVAAFDSVHRGDNSDGGDSRLFGLFAELDRSATTWAADLVYVDGDGATSGWFGGVSAIRRVGGRLNLSVRLLGSEPLGGESDAVGRGLLGVVGLSAAPPGTHDLVYLNLVAAAGRYTAAARAPDRGGPLGRIGILFEAPGVGGIGAPLSNDADHVLGGAVGYQRFFREGRLQVVLELGGRTQHDASPDDGMLAGGLRFQRALGRRLVLRLDGWVGHRDASGAFAGGRGEVVVKF